MKNKIILTILACALSMSLIVGCSKSTAKQQQNIGDGYQTIAAEDYNYGMNGASGASSGKGFEYEPETWETGNGDNGSGNGSTDVNVDPTKGRLLIRTVNMSVETKEIEKVKTDLEILVGADGGYIESSNMSGTGKDKNLRTLTYTIRVPADQLDAIIAAVGNSCTVLSSNENSVDVTLEYVDTKSRVESLRVEYDQLMTLLKNADDLDQIITLQNRLTEVRYQIESYESRLRVLENQVTYATLNLTIREVLEDTVIEPAHVPTYGEKVQKQFEEMLDNTKEFFEDLGLVIIACLPGIIFLSINAIIIVVIIKSAKKKRRKAREQKLSLENQSKEETLYLGGNGKAHIAEPPKPDDMVKLAGDVAMPTEVTPVKDYEQPEYAKAGKVERINEIPPVLSGFVSIHEPKEDKSKEDKSEEDSDK